MQFALPVAIRIFLQTDPPVFVPLFGMVPRRQLAPILLPITNQLQLLITATMTILAVVRSMIVTVIRVPVVVPPARTIIPPPVIIRATR